MNRVHLHRKLPFCKYKIHEVRGFGKGIGVVLGGLLIVLLLYWNIALYYQPVITIDHGYAQDEDLLCELRGLRRAMHAGAADDMQQLYPEGYIFMHALYALAWAEVAARSEVEGVVFDEAFREVENSCRQLSTNAAREIFDELLPLSYGAFYQGWYNYVTGKKLLLQAPSKRSAGEVEAFQRRCEDIARAIQSTETPYPASYRFGTWPADATVGVASLALHDKLFVPKYNHVMATWIVRVRQKLDSHGLIPHAVDPAGVIQEEARGSSQSLMLSFLPEIDAAFARDQFSRYQTLFVTYRFGLPCIREYPVGTVGLGDIDSGPVILQAGAAASLAGLRTLAIQDEQQLYVGLRNSIEAFGVPTTYDGGKQYLFGQLPMADAFIAWGHAAADPSTKAEGTWRLPFHLYSVGLLLLVTGVWFYFQKRRVKTSE
jgi:hypothetical protein